MTGQLGSVQYAWNRKSTTKGIVRYGLTWSANDPLSIDLQLIREFPNTARSDNPQVREVTSSWNLDDWFALFKSTISLTFPTYVHQKWSDLIIRCWLESNYLGIMGAASSGKTYTAAALTLLEWYADPANTFGIVSSTSLPELKRRVLGVVFDLHREAKEQHDWLPGREVRAENGIYLVAHDGLPNLRRGIMGLATVSTSGEAMKGIRGIGQKAPKMIHLADELQLMTANFVGASANLAANAKYSLRGLGNPTSIDDELGKLCEPVAGWNSMGESVVARTWKTRSGLALQLPGMDTPNENSDPPKYIGILTKRFIAQTLARFGESDIRYRCFALGAIPSSSGNMVVADRTLVQRMQAATTPEFSGPVTRFAGLDPAFGGGDRCIASFASVGPDRDGQTLIALDTCVVIPVEVSPQATMEEAISMAFRLECERRGIPPQRAGYDATFSSIASALGRVWSVQVVPVLFSGLPVDPDPSLGEGELTIQEFLPSQRFGKRVTQIVWRVREAIETGCVRGLTEDVAIELSRRRWRVIARTGVVMKMDVEPKQEYHLRHGESPDFSDSLAVTLEVMARNGVRLRPIRSDRDEEIIASTPIHVNLARDIDSAEDEALLRRMQRTQTPSAQPQFATVAGIPSPKPPPNTAWVHETRVRTVANPGTADETEAEPARAHEAIRSLNRFMHGY